MNPPVVRTLIGSALPLCGNAVLTDVRLGLGYSAVQLDGETAGISWSPKAAGQRCTVLPLAGTLVGRKAAEVLPWLEEPENPWFRTIALATLNALVHRQPAPAAEKRDIVTALNPGPQDRVAMVGCFHPLVKPIRAHGAHLDIIELDGEDDETLSPEEGRKALQSCTIAIVTATSLVTGTLASLLSDLAGRGKPPRAAVLLGPSTPLFPQAFAGTPITHLAGSWVHSPLKVLQIVSEGGGTPQLKPHLTAITQELSSRSAPFVHASRNCPGEARS